MLLWGSLGFGGVLFFVWLNNYQRDKRLKKRKSYRGSLKARLKEKEKIEINKPHPTYLIPKE